MRHLRKGRKFGRVRKVRRSLLRNLAAAFFAQGKITTTEAKAKELRPMVEHMISQAKQGDLARRRHLAARLPRKTVTKLTHEIAPRFSTRPGGYTRIIKVGKRKGDSAALALLELIK